MLVFKRNRKPLVRGQDTIVIGEGQLPVPIRVKVLSGARTTKIGVEAPRELRVDRAEVTERLAAERRAG